MDGNKTTNGREGADGPEPVAQARLTPGHKTQPQVERLILWRRDVASALGVSLRTVDRMLSMREIPQPGLRLRGRPCWRAETITAWVRAGCPVPSQSVKVT